MTFRRKIFLAAFATACVTALAATALASWTVRRDMLARLERSLVAEARLGAELMAHLQTADDDALDDEADAIGQRIGARVTLIAADGRVLGDSERDGAELAAMENHSRRPEVLAALAAGAGVSTRHSSTIDTDMMYVAVPVGAHRSRVAVVRLALPLTEVRDQLDTVRRVALLALAAGLGTALALAWWASVLVSRRVDAIAASARRYAQGDYTRRPADYGSDEIGTVARVLDQAVQDLSARVAELARDRALTAGILSGMSEGVIVVDARGQLQLVNEAARRMLGLSTALEGRHYLEAVRHPGITGQLGATIAGDAAPAVEVTLSGDRERVFISRAAAVEAPGGRIAVVVLHDVSDLKRADRVRRDFVANVSHELRTPLTAIRGYVEALIDDASDPEQTQKFLRVVARHSERMERLVRDLLRLARIEGGQERADRADVEVAGLFSDVRGTLAPFLEARRQRVDVTIEAGASRIRVDAPKIQDVLRNLLENASRYAPEGTTIRLRARAEGERAILEVQDEGPGIPEQDLTRVFERFYRVDKARAREAGASDADAGGTGLGLAIVKHLVSLHGGSVAARNATGGGAVFTVSLPSAADPALD